MIERAMARGVTSKFQSVPRNRRYAVLMAGGAGTRFWPWSRVERPKQLLPLAGAGSMLAATVSRLRGVVPPKNILVVTGRNLRRGVARSLPSLPSESILCEPIGRNTAACIGWAAVEVRHRNPEAVMIVLPADHVVRPVDAFRRAVERALAIADTAKLLVTFGIEPRDAHTGYGYISASRRLAGADGALRVDSFHEKPSAARARRYLRSGSHYWNSGMFAWRADVILAEIDKHDSQLAAGLKEMVSARRGGRIPRSTIDHVYQKLRSVSVDHAIMEKSNRAAMLPVSFDWNDIGSWDAIAALWPCDAHGNSARSPVVAIKSSNNIVATEGKPVALLGVDDLAVIDSGDALLVCRRELAQDVRAIVAALDSKGLGRLK